MTDSKIVELIESSGTVRRLRLEDGSIIERSGGSASWRHNNPGNLKFEYAGSADTNVHSRRSYGKALDTAQHLYHGIIGLDHHGNAIFESPEAGRAAQVQLIRKHGDQTVEQLIHGYSTPDYSGPTHYEQQLKAIHNTAATVGLDLHGKIIDKMTPVEINALADGISHFEGYRTGHVKLLDGLALDAAKQPSPAAMSDIDHHAKPLLNDPSHSDHAAFVQVLKQVQAAEIAHEIKPGEHSLRVAGALLVEMRRDDITRADRVEINLDGSLIRAVQVSPIRDEPGLNRVTRPIETQVAVQQSMENSGLQLAQLDAQVMSHVPAMPVQQQARVHAH